ncbi:hypothetical protein GCM10012275_16430 [Longimycelium tulufanense]|uniref:M23ase beta-sheet core domain-containing protein n=1 Tax=Longimycelium tulufanense TaxID=907463 RepID=A0A8J3FU06_9PSEU|nr:peptidoglycan DD-metalloendopeptidase family protein [Longimycelium tulufanense]GGM46139.1 hypothetical protein GCM10012275_16430 [Longimycelium tulufanense]
MSYRTKLPGGAPWRGATAFRPISRALVLTAGAALLLASPAAAEPPKPNPGQLEAAVRAAMLAQNGAQAKKDYKTDSLPEPVVETQRTAGSDWAFGTATLPAPTTTPEAPRTALFVAKRTDGRWRTELQGGSGFAELAKQAPDSVVDGEEKNLFAKVVRAEQTDYARAEATQEGSGKPPEGKPGGAAGEADGPRGGLDTGLGLPWSKGMAWRLGGVHGNTGSSLPMNSIDFFGGDGQVRAAAGGRLYKSCQRGDSALVSVVHDNGYTTTYYHMTNLTNLANGSRIQEGTYLGRTGTRLPCGGSANGNHVHFSVKRGNREVPVAGKTLGGWTFFQGGGQYQGGAERGNQRVAAFRGNITNFGSSGGNTPPPDAGKPPTDNNRPKPPDNKPKPPDNKPGNKVAKGTVDSGRYAGINLRSGPGTNYEVRTRVRTGQTLNIACTARGESIQGLWGRTNLWNKLDNGMWISDGFLNTGSNDPVAPACDAGDKPKPAKDDAPKPPADKAVKGTVDSGPHAGVNVRGGPGTRFAVRTRLRTGQTVNIVCAARGENIPGVKGMTDRWNKLDDGTWISAGFVNVGNNGAVPACR